MKKILFILFVSSSLVANEPEIISCVCVEMTWTSIIDFFKPYPIDYCLPHQTQKQHEEEMKSVDNPNGLQDERDLCNQEAFDRFSKDN